MQKRAFSFVEVLIATAIIAVVMVPIAGMMRQSFSQVSGQRMESAVASYAAKVVNEWIFEKDYDDLDVSVGAYTVEEQIGVDQGIDVKVDIAVYEVDPPGSPGISGNDMTFEYYRIPYHSPCSGGAETNDYDSSIDSDNLRNVDRSDPPYTPSIDSKYQGASAKPPLKTICFTFQWKGVWEAWPAVGSREERLRTRFIICRRANLE